MHSANGTSFQEQAIFYYVKQLFPDAINREQYAFDDSGEIEIDIYIPSLHFAIEYDGVYWHKNKTDRDYHKNTVLSNAGAHLLRVRDCGLDDLKDGFAEVIYHKVSPDDKGLHLRDVINEVVRSIKLYIDANQLTVDDTVQKLLSAFALTKEKLIEDRPNLYAQYVTAYQKDNISKTCLIKFWDFEKNGNLMPNNVSIKANIFVVLTCPCGHSFHIQPSLFKLNINQEEKECKQCMLKYCPAIFKYPTVCDTQNCNVYNELISTLKYIPIEESRNWYYKHSSFDRCQKRPEIEESTCTKLLATNPNLPYRKMQKTIANKLAKDPDSISSKNLLRWLISLDYNERFMFLKTEEKLLDEFLDIILVNDALVIGAPISGIIANTIISTPVAAMKKCCDKCGVAFTVYADDMTFSSETFLRKEFVQDIFNTSMSQYKLDEYFKINPEKIVGISNHRRRVTGVSINSKDELCVKRRMYRDIRSILERMSHKKPVTYSNKEISGKLAFVIMIENSEKVNALLEKYKDILISEKLMSEKTLEKRGIHV
jgi:hypothetical protein